MKTPTIIMRLIGLYLLVNCSLGLISLHEIQSLAGAQKLPLSSNAEVYFIIGLVIGTMATLFAGPLARLLTFDSEAEDPAETTERLIKG